jgi:hypothetical protein
MSMHQTNEADLQAIYAGWSDEQLITAATTDRSQYRPEALPLIRQELSRRNVVLPPTPPALPHGTTDEPGRRDLVLTFLLRFDLAFLAATFAALCVVARLLNFGWVTFFFGIPMLMFLTGHTAAVAFLTWRLQRVRFGDYVVVIAVSAAYLATALLVPDGGDVGGSYAVMGRVRNPGPEYETWARECFFGGLTVELMWHVIGWFRVRAARVE